MQLKQLPQCHALEGAKALAVLVAKKLLGVLRAEALYHTLSIQRLACYVKSEDPMRESKPSPLGGLKPVGGGPAHLIL